MDADLVISPPTASVDSVIRFVLAFTSVILLFDPQVNLKSQSSGSQTYLFRHNPTQEFWFSWNVECRTSRS